MEEGILEAYKILLSQVLKQRRLHRQVKPAVKNI